MALRTRSLSAPPVRVTVTIRPDTHPLTLLRVGALRLSPSYSSSSPGSPRTVSLPLGATVFIFIGLVLVDFAHSSTETCLKNWENSDSNLW